MNESFLLSLLAVHSLAVVSPGPNFAIVINQAITNGRTAGYLCAAGVTCGVFFHILYSNIISITGLSTVPNWDSWIKYLGSCYLFFIGIKQLIPVNIKEELVQNPKQSTFAESATSGRPLLTGALTAATNPKAALYFLSIFGSFVPADASLSIRAICAIAMLIVTSIWHILLARMSTIDAFKLAIKNNATSISRAFGLVLIGFSISIIFG